MVRSLMVRRVFHLLDVVLVILMIGAGAAVVHQFLTPAPILEAAVESVPESAAETVALMQKPAERSHYAALSRGGLFGPAGRWDPKAAPPPPPVEPEVLPDIVESTLNLALKGTIALSPGNPFSAAFIEDAEMRGSTRAFLIGQEVVDNVTLTEVYPREVILLNERHAPPQSERLRMHDPLAAEGAAPSPKNPGAPPSSAPRSATPARPAAPASASSGDGNMVQRITVNRDQIIDEAFANYSALIAVRPELARDESGNVLGLTASGIGSIPMAQKLGFQDNDILQTVNNERVDSEEKIMELLMRYQNATSFRIGILRDGMPRILTYNLE